MPVFWVLVVVLSFLVPGLCGLSLLDCVCCVVVVGGAARRGTRDPRVLKRRFSDPNGDGVLVGALEGF